jgi:hypothetical protein
MIPSIVVVWMISTLTTEWMEVKVELSHTTTLEGIIHSVVKVEIIHTTTLEGIIRSVVKVEIVVVWMISTLTTERMISSRVVV